MRRVKKDDRRPAKESAASVVDSGGQEQQNEPLIAAKGQSGHEISPSTRDCGRRRQDNVPPDQEFIIKRNGAVAVPWMIPQATALILSLWHELEPGSDFPVIIIDGPIYCG